VLELALHILDIAENSTRAGARNVCISVDEDTSSDRFRLVIEDDGAGMGPEEAVKALDPFFTTKKVRRVGLGLPMLAQAADSTGGGLKLESEPGKGTRVSVEMGLAHIDRQPLGDIPGALVALIAGNPEINIVYRHARDGKDISPRHGGAEERTGGCSDQPHRGIAVYQEARVGRSGANRFACVNHVEDRRKRYATTEGILMKF